ncbi:hypothetical protein LBMAG46_03400 [Planctomycetia bacterium]|nr:hypothetical protein LBMAG46_03400 [Planctomycetia bacterium]
MRFQTSGEFLVGRLAVIGGSSTGRTIEKHETAVQIIAEEGEPCEEQPLLTAEYGHRAATEPA